MRATRFAAAAPSWAMKTNKTPIHNQTLRNVASRNFYFVRSISKITAVMGFVTDLKPDGNEKSFPSGFYLSPPE